MKRDRLYCLCESAVMVAAALALSYLKVKLWADGGSVDLVMVPLLVLALRRGVLWGTGAGLVFGTLKCLLSGGMAYGWASLLLDYSIAYAMVGLAGLLKKHPLSAASLACCARTAIHVLSGVVVWAWMPEVYLGRAMHSLWIYSLLYNGSYMLPNTLLALAAVAALCRAKGILPEKKAG